MCLHSLLLQLLLLWLALLHFCCQHASLCHLSCDLTRMGEKQALRGNAPRLLLCVFQAIRQSSDIAP